MQNRKGREKFLDILAYTLLGVMLLALISLLILSIIWTKGIVLITFGIFGFALGVMWALDRIFHRETINDYME